MISKSRKILTLLLTVLLIMSSMSVINVSAATTFNVSGGNFEVSSETTSNTYTFSNVPVTGYYELMLKNQGASTNGSGKVYSVTGTIGDETSVAFGVVNTGLTYPVVGSYYLEAGSEYTITLAFDFSQLTSTKLTIQNLTFTKVEDIEVSSTQETKINALNFLRRDFRRSTRDDESSTLTTNTKGDETGWKGGAVAGTGKYGIYRVSVPNTTLYDVYILTGNTATATASLYVDNVQINVTGAGKASNVSVPATGSTNSDYYTAKYKKLGRVAMVAGSHDIMIKINSGTVYFYGFKLVPVNDQAKVASNSGTTEFSFYHDMLLGDTKINYSAASYTTYPEAGLTVNAANGYVSSGGSSHYATFGVYVEDAGIYDISFVGGRYTVGVTVYLDDVVPSHKSFGSPSMANASKTLPSGAAASTAAFKDDICSLYLTEGFHKIKFKFGTSGYFYTWEIKPTSAVTNLSATGTTTIAAQSTKYYDHNSDQTAEFLDGGVVVVRKGKTYYYVVNSPEETKYTLTTKTAGPSRVTMTVTDFDRDTVLYSGIMGEPSGTGNEAYFAPTETELGQITLKAGRTVLKIVPNGAVYVHEYRLTPVVENKIIADVNATIAQGEGFETVTVPIKFEGNLTLASLQVDVEYEKDEGVEFVSYAAGTCYAGGAVLMAPVAGSRPVSVAWMDYQSFAGEFTTGTFATLTFKVPKNVAKDYTFTVTISDCQDSSFAQIANTITTVNGKVTVVSTDPIITFTNGSDAAVEDVVEGTMKLSVDLNGNAKDLVIFAIYSQNGDYAVMEYSQNATIENGVATATINNITLASGVNYYAKAFVWDTTSYYGFTQTIGR